MRKGEQKRQEILDAAEALFFHRGYEETSVQDILDVLRCSKGSFYHHFDSKLDLLKNIASHHANISRQEFSLMEPKDPTEALRRLLYHAGLFRKEEIGLLRNLRSLQNKQEGPVLLDALQKASNREFFTEFSNVLNELKSLDLASFSGEHILNVSFHSLLSGCALILEETAALRKEDAIARGILLLRAMRSQIEASLGLRAGSAVITETSELAEILKMLSGQ